MNTHLEKNNVKVTTNLLITANIATDGFVELIVDVRGAYIIRDRLKTEGFRFVREVKENEKPTATWRRIFVAVPPAVSIERAAIGIEMAIDELEKMLNGIFDGTKVRGAKSAAAAMTQHWGQSDVIAKVSDRLSTLDTPWDNQVKRPEFAA
ncbi:hypothetical protein [Cerasicoccus fimbriatus]|uniref:hypothetical protein n=1 Tax=Cerasicoccus fimbriatus TaxID=3014554 RepID=UPI0022B50665|nr:hypothetical protein [Cerasicoccus sp. TK19100]